MAPLLRALTTSDGEPVDCPICLSEVLTLNSFFTPCCAKPFHAHCLKSQTKCPMCRTPMADAARESIGQTAHASGGGAHGSLSDQQGGVSREDIFMQMTNVERREAALALAFESAAFRDDVTTRHDCGAGSNYGWRAMVRGAY